MGWLPCSETSNKKTIKKKKKKNTEPVDQIKPTSEKLKRNPSLDIKEVSRNGGPNNIAAQTFAFRELAAATKNFRADSFLGEGGFGRVYKGRLETTKQARPLFNDRRKLSLMADPILQGQYPMRGLYQALAIAAMCVQEQPTMRPLMADVVTALNFLAMQTYDPDTQQNQSSRMAPSTPPRTKRDSNKKLNGGSGSGRDRKRS
ncbi:hypothetical protein L1049_008619 [Liquidambar formosana]|uniref:Uncharacterized protein n=1 Tax=Liquidambar formosana TaxID=63359 RepID=A0AAP0SB16_LIQFO